MTDCILSLPFRTVTDKHLHIISNKKKRRYCSRYDGKMLQDPLFLLKRPVPLIYSKVDSIMTRFVIMVHLECPCNNKLLSSLLDRRIMSNLTDFETKSRRTLRRDENLGQLSSIPV